MCTDTTLLTVIFITAVLLLAKHQKVKWPVLNHIVKHSSLRFLAKFNGKLASEHLLKLQQKQTMYFLLDHSVVLTVE